MDRVPTGFPELDKLLDSGIPRPSLISVRGEFGTSQRAFLFQLIQNFLENGLKGLYVSADRPADEVKAQIAKLGIDYTPYYKEYSIYFLDFFTESQKILFGDSNKATLKYTPAELLGSLNPYLDWIKNGFLVIDSASTLVLNTDAKGTYDFVRGGKLVGRLFNLIMLGIYQMPITDIEGFNQVYTNADGSFTFTKGKIAIENFENIRNSQLLVSKGEDGKLVLKPPVPTGINEETGINTLEVLSKSGSLKIEPLLTVEAMPKTKDSMAELISALEKMEETKIVNSKPHCTSLICPRCNALALELYVQCPECESRLLEKWDVIEHFQCGYTEFESNFKTNGKLICPRCGKELKQMGVDYRRVDTGYRCVNKHLFSNPSLCFVCSECKEKFNLSDAKLKNQYKYELTEEGQLQAKRVLTNA